MRTVTTAPDSLVARHALVAFFALAYLISWPLFLVAGATHLRWLTVPGLFGPALAAVLVTAATEGQPALHRLLGRFLIWRINPGWFAFALLLPAATYIIAAHLAPAKAGAPTWSPSRQWYLIPLVYLGLCLVVIGEELGWRGFALPRFQQRWSALLASLGLALPWAIWHVAIRTNPVAPNLGSIAGLAFIPFVFAIAIILTAIFNNTAGSLVAVVAYHASGDVAGFFLKLTARAYDLNVAITLGVALLLVGLLGPTNLARTADRVTR